MVAEHIKVFPILPLPQMEHTYGLNPEWIRRWSLKLHSCLKSEKSRCESESDESSLTLLLSYLFRICCIEMAWKDNGCGIRNDPVIILWCLPNIRMNSFMIGQMMVLQKWFWAKFTFVLCKSKRNVFVFVIEQLHVLGGDESHQLTFIFSVRFQMIFELCCVEEFHGTVRTVVFINRVHRLPVFVQINFAFKSLPTIDAFEGVVWESLRFVEQILMKTAVCR